MYLWYSFKEYYQIVLLFVIFITQFGISKSSTSTRRVLVISLDGFGQEYLTRFQLPNLMKLYHAGSHPITLMNQYPTKTFPNHFSIATGLYTESHGVVANSLYDPRLDRILNVSHSELFQQKKEVQPLWVVNEKHGGVSACLMWPGCGLSYQDTNESISLAFSPKYAFRPLLDVALNLLIPSSNRKIRVARDDAGEAARDDAGKVAHDDAGNAARGEVSSTVSSNETEKEKVESLSADDIENMLVYSVAEAQNRTANLVMLYYPQPDAIGHLYGAESAELEAVLLKIDNDLGYLLERLFEPAFLNQVDLILLSDHGMVDVVPQNIITLKDFIDPSLFTIAGASPQLHVYPAPGMSIAVFSKLEAAAKTHNFSVLIKEDLPEYLHYKHNDRIAEFLLQANPGYVFDDDASYFVKRPEDQRNRPIGMHGYAPNTCPAMLPILVAVGPSFRTNWRVPTANSVDVFPLVCSLLSLPPPPNNGSLDALALMMNSPPLLATLAEYFIGFACVVGAITLLSLACYCRGRKSSSHQHTRRRIDSQALISGTAYRPMQLDSLSCERPSAIMLSEDELEEEQKLLAQADEWDV